MSSGRRKKKAEVRRVAPMRSTVEVEVDGRVAARQVLVSFPGSHYSSGYNWLLVRGTVATSHTPAILLKSNGK